MQGMFARTPRCGRCGASMNITTTHRCKLIPVTDGDHAPLIGRILPAPPRCSRCKCRKVFTWASLLGNIRYERQCARCIRWSRESRRDPLRCLDCRRWLNTDVENWSEEDREFQRRYGRVECRRCFACNRAKLGRESAKRRSNGRWNPLSPFWNRPELNDYLGGQTR
jgi:hypothetical protein